MASSSTDRWVANAAAAIATVALLVAVLTGKRSWNRWAVVVAMVVMFAIFSIPHSMRGSQLNHQTGVIESAK